jgi:putative methyltransferase
LFAAEHLLRTDPEDDLEGFFIALFVRKAAADESSAEPSKDGMLGAKRKRVCTTRNNGLRAFSSLRLSRMDALCSIWRL